MEEQDKTSFKFSLPCIISNINDKLKSKMTGLEIYLCFNFVFILRGDVVSYNDIIFYRNRSKKLSQEMLFKIDR